MSQRVQPGLITPISFAARQLTGLAEAVADRARWLAPEAVPTQGESYLDHRPHGPEHRVRRREWRLGEALRTAAAQEPHHGGGDQGHASPYAGLETREIKSMSEEDIEVLQQGSGWGLALPAELNGVPGPVHLLELRKEVSLSEDQVSAVEAIEAEMRLDAIEAGERFIVAEAALDAAFAAADLDEARLRRLIDAVEVARADMRFVHLSRHLSTPELLMDEQIHRYGELRGYGSDDACHDTAEEQCH